LVQADRAHEITIDDVWLVGWIDCEDGLLPNEAFELSQLLIDDWTTNTGRDSLCKQCFESRRAV
jgi:hypothetical protein